MCIAATAKTWELMLKSFYAYAQWHRGHDERVSSTFCQLHPKAQELVKLTQLCNSLGIPVVERPRCGLL